MLISRRLSPLLLAAAALFPALASAQVAPSNPPAAAAPAAAASASGDNTVLIRGPAGEVTTAQFLAAVEQLVPAAQRESFYSNPRNIEQLAISIYSRQNLATQAQQQGFAQKPEVARRTAIAQQQALSDIWVANQAEARLPSAEQIEQYARSAYVAQPADLTDTVQLRVRHIMIAPSSSLTDAQAKAKADSVLAQLKAGAVFEQLARSESTDKGSGARGGELQAPMELGRELSAFESAAAALSKPGEISGVVKSREGYHIIQLIERKTLSGFERRRAELIDQARAQLMSKARSEVLVASQAGAEPNTDAISALVRARPAR